MRLHRFYVGADIKLKHDFWLREPKLLWQWGRVLRFRAGQQVVLFDGVKHERLYKLESISDKQARLSLVTEFKPKVPAIEVYLLFSLLKKDKNDWILQKGTELGVSHFWPVIALRSEKTGFDVERARKIVIEASEQCGRSDLPTIQQPLLAEGAIKKLVGKAQLWVAEQETDKNALNTTPNLRSKGVLIGPEGGWTDTEKELFNKYQLPFLDLHDFTLRAETAAIAGILKLIQ